MVWWMEAEGLRSEQAAADRQIVVKAVREAIEYVRDNRQLLDEEIGREERVRRKRELIGTTNVSGYGVQIETVSLAKSNSILSRALRIARIPISGRSSCGSGSVVTSRKGIPGLSSNLYGVAASAGMLLTSQRSARGTEFP